MRASRMLVLLVVLLTSCDGAVEGNDAGVDGASDDASSSDGGACAGSEDGTECGDGLVCSSGACVERGCGDGWVDVAAGEQCDDGNGTAFDGCDPPSCTFTCVPESDPCSDDDPCDGLESCSSEHVCVDGTTLADGTACTSPTVSGVCRSGTCVPPGCSNGVVETGEDCDDANTTDGDGCETSCTFSCLGDLDCTDDDVCTGLDTCMLSTHTCISTPALDCGDTSACTADSCDPIAGCRNELIDVDGDGHASEDLGICGTDCDDTDDGIHPDAQELCDTVDQDCDGNPTAVTPPTWYLDCDDDDYASTTAGAVSGCMPPPATPCTTPSGAPAPVGWTSRLPVNVSHTDCDDADAAINPSVTEVVGDPSGDDEDCDGSVTCYRDADSDGARTSVTVASADADCADSGEAYATAAIDCADTIAAAHPGATEVAGDDGNVDEDCSGGILCYVDGDGDASRTDTTIASADSDCLDAGEARASLPAGDCADANPLIHPGAAEIAGDDASADEDCSGGILCYADDDDDNYRAMTTRASSDSDCGDSGEAYANATLDCADANASVNPAATEIAGDAADVDEDCSGPILCFIDGDGDGYRLTSTVLSTSGCGAAGAAYAAEPTGDCDDANAGVSPGDVEAPGDAGDLDEDCSGGITCHPNADADGFRTSATIGSMDGDCMDAGEAYAVIAGGDCNDNDAAISPGDPEIVGDASDVDENCDTRIACYTDGDNDGARLNTMFLSGDPDCADANEGRSADMIDCNDGNASISPLVAEVYGNDIDESCDGRAGCYTDADDDGTRTNGSFLSTDADCADMYEGLLNDSVDCCDTNPMVRPGQTAWFTTRYNCGAGFVWDYNCSGGTVEQQDTDATASCGSPSSCPANTGWSDGSMPTCGSIEPYLTSCTSAGSFCIPITEDREQGCH